MCGEQRKNILDMCGKQRKNILVFQFGKYVKDRALCCHENLHYRPKRKEK